MVLEDIPLRDSAKLGCCYRLLYLWFVGGLLEALEVVELLVRVSEVEDVLFLLLLGAAKHVVDQLDLIEIVDPVIALVELLRHMREVLWLHYLVEAPVLRRLLWRLEACHPYQRLETVQLSLRLRHPGRHRLKLGLQTALKLRYLVSYRLLRLFLGISRGLLKSCPR